jgi:hypothetical protein
VAAGILGAGTLGGLARVKGVLLGREGGVGGWPRRVPLWSSGSRSCRNMAWEIRIRGIEGEEMVTLLVQASLVKSRNASARDIFPET